MRYFPFTIGENRVIMSSGGVFPPKKAKKQKIHIKRKEIENGYQTQKDFNGW